MTGIDVQLGLVEGLILRPGARDVARLGIAYAGALGRVARRMVADLAPGRCAGLVTGAYMAWADDPAAETDGPVGVAALAAMLDALGHPPLVVTDEPCVPVVRACLDVVGLSDRVVAVPAGASVDAVLDAVRPLPLNHLVAVERLGPNAAGRVLTMRAHDVTEFTAPLHVLFESTGMPTAAIGDGGNEIGMGTVPIDLLGSVVEHAERIACRTRADELVVAGTSNWGCYGLVAALGILSKDHDAAAAVLRSSFDDALLRAAADAGGIDGVNGTRALSVDGVAADGYGGLVDALRYIATGE